MSKYLITISGYKPAKLIGYYTDRNKKMVHVCWDNYGHKGLFKQKSFPVWRIIKVKRIKSKFEKWLIKHFAKQKNR